MNDNELMNRRRFFKKAAKGLLPMLGAFAAAPTILASLTSCGGCDDCEAACMDGCEDTCSGTCSDGCSGGSTGSSSGCSDCSSTCSGSSTGAGCSDCANDCSSSCSGSSTSTTCSSCSNDCSSSCNSTCNNTCSATCEGSAQGKTTTGIVNGHEYVDLGLSVLWAKSNVGAKEQDDYGDYYAFADTTGQVKGYGDIAKDYYSPLDFQDGQSISGTYLDAATAKWRGNWRMPISDEITELVDNCSFETFVSSKSGEYGQRTCIKFVSNLKSATIIQYTIKGRFMSR